MITKVRSESGTTVIRFASKVIVMSTPTKGLVITAKFAEESLLKFASAMADSIGYKVVKK